MESTPSPLVHRARSRDSPIPHEELPSPLSRGKRPMTRSRGQGDNMALDVPSSPQRKAKRPRLSSASGPVRTIYIYIFLNILIITTIIIIMFYYIITIIRIVEWCYIIKYILFVSITQYVTLLYIHTHTHTLYLPCALCYFIYFFIIIIFYMCPYLYICNSCILCMYIYVCVCVCIYIYIYIYYICIYIYIYIYIYINIYYIYIYIYWFVFLYFYVLLLVFSVICMHQGSESNAISILYVCTVHVAELTKKQTLTFFDFDTGSVTIITVYKVIITIERYNITTYIFICLLPTWTNTIEF